jgi:two-component system, NarL family, response regulator NreC
MPMRPADQTSPAVTVVLADDHAIVRSAVRSVLEEEPGVQVVAEAADIATAVRKVNAYKPRVLVLDLNLPDGSGVDAIPRFLEVSPGTAIIILTMDNSLEQARAALRAGAFGFTLKEAADTELIEAVQAASRGRKYLDPQLGARAAIEEEYNEPPDHLSTRELQVMRLVALGYMNKEIAARLGLSVRTVECHRSHLEHKTDTSTRAEVSKYAREHHLVG